MAPHLIYPRDGGCLCPAQATLAQRSSTPQTAWAGPPSPNAPSRWIQLAVPIPKAESSREHMAASYLEESVLNPTALLLHPSVLVGLGCRLVNWRPQPEPTLSPQVSGKGNAFSREGELRQWPGLVPGEQERVGCCWDCRLVPCSNGKCTAETPLTPLPRLGVPRRRCSCSCSPGPSKGSP